MKRSQLILSHALMIGLTIPAFAPIALAGTENTITVTTTVDVMDALDQQCSLREALANANNNTAFGNGAGECAAGSALVTDVIALAQSAVYPLTIAGGGDDQGDLDVLAEASIEGPALRIATPAGAGDPAAIVQQVAGERVIENHAANLAIRRVVIANGSVDGAGGGLYNAHGILALTEVTLEGNHANSGGGLYNDGEATLTDSSFYFNEATFVGGGGAFNATNAVLAIVHSRVEDNEGPGGGGVYNDGGSVYVSSQSVFASNATNGDGGAVLNTGAGLFFSNDSRFEGNSASETGGGVKSSSSLAMGITNTDFVGNSAAAGGALWIVGNGNTEVVGGLFDNNEATVSSGGAILANQVAINHSRFTGNTAVQHGGAAFGALSLDVSDSSFSDNSADTGGAIDAQFLTLTRTSVTENTAGTYGGGVHVFNSATIERSRIEGNAANTDGGGIWLSGNGTSRISRSLVSNNVGFSQGGGVWVNGPGSLAIDNTTISGNGASGGAGGLYIEDDGNVTATNMTLAYNTVGKDLYKYGDLTLRNSIISTPGQDDCTMGLDNPTIVSLGNNLADDTSCFGLDQPSDHTGVDAKLDVLAANGGNTKTHALLPGSPALDAGNAAACASPAIGGVDQRGVVRTFGSSCDIGAHEQSDTIFADGFD